MTRPAALAEILSKRCSSSRELKGNDRTFRMKETNPASINRSKTAPLPPPPATPLPVLPCSACFHGGACLTTTVYFYLQRPRSAFYLPGTRHEPRFRVLRRNSTTYKQPPGTLDWVVVIPAMLLTLNRSTYILARVPAKIIFIPLSFADGQSFWQDARTGALCAEVYPA